MKTHLINWNKKSLLWKITDLENFWAGEYLLADCTNAREKFLMQHTHKIDTILQKQTKGSNEFLAYLKKRFITFSEYLLLIERKSFATGKKNDPSFVQMYWELINEPSRKLLLSDPAAHEQNYLTLFKKWLPDSQKFFFTPDPVPVPMHALRRHLLITGKTGSGKTNFLQTLFYQLQFNDLQKQQSSMVLIDPHGDISEKLFALRINIQHPNRIWYIDPQWDSDKVPCLNPFWTKVKDPVLLDLLSQQWAKAFTELIPEAGMSLQMEALLKPCLSIMFQSGGCGLTDLQEFMDDTQNEKWVERGKQSSHPVFRSFFNSAFLNKKYAPTKLAIYTRLQLLLNNYSFHAMMNGPNTVDLKKGMQQGKIILFNLSKGKLGEDTSKALGRFITATLLSIALQRAFVSERSRKSCYLFVDEFHNLASGSMETIFSEARKYRLHLIVGTQTVGQLPLSLRNMVQNNTAIKLVGLNGLPALKSEAGDIGVSYANLQVLEPYHFYLKYDHYPALKIKSTDFMLKQPKKYFASEKEIANLKDFVIHKSGLYRERSRDGQVPASGSTSKPNVPSPPASDNFTPEFGL